MKKQNQEIVLSPAQQRTFDSLRCGTEIGDILLLKARAGCGRSIILNKLHEAVGGALLGAKDFMHTLSARQPEAVEETFLRMVEQALAHHEIVIVDDLHLVTQAVSACDYSRTLLLDAALTALMGEAAALRKKLVFGSDDEVPWPLARRAFTWKLAEFEPEDYACICRNLLGEAAGSLDFAQVHRYAPALTAEQLRHTCIWLVRGNTVDTRAMIEYLRSPVEDTGAGYFKGAAVALP
jgi:transitional endoplasmic reticulum ATPase